MRRFVDLHTHSTASDGGLAPADLVAAADHQHLAALALTDHDTLSGLDEARAAARAAPDLTFIAGIEVSARFDGGTMHMLGLGIDPADEGLAALCRTLQQARDERNPLILAKLRGMGIEITDDDVAQVAGQLHAGQDCAVTSRVHIAETLRRMGRAESIVDAFDRYIGAGRPAHVHKWRPPAGDVIAAIDRAGGLGVLAHPSQLNCANRAQLERIVRDLRGRGLAGIEAYHSNHTPEQTRRYLDLARGLGLGVSGGSDFHGPARLDVQLARPRVPVGALTGRVADLLTRPAAESPSPPTAPGDQV